MLPIPIEHRFTIDGDQYLLVEWTRGGMRRIRADYAMAIAAAPGVMDTLDGADLYAEAIARECLKEAPAIFWEDLPAQSVQNGQPRRVVSLERVPRRLWDEFRKGVDAFQGLLFPPTPTPGAGGADAGAGDTATLAPVETLSPVFRGRAE